MEYRELRREEIMDVYLGRAKVHFPAAERKPPETIDRLYGEGIYRGIGCFQEDRLAAYAFFVCPKELEAVLLDYFAVMEEYRSSGVGGRFLEEMKQIFYEKQGILIETENIEEAANEQEETIRRRRNVFYVANGAFDTGIRSRIEGVPYYNWFLPVEGRTLEKASNPLPMDTDQILTALKEVYSLLMPDKQGAEIQFWVEPKGEKPVEN